MLFNDNGNQLLIIFEKEDTDTEKRFIERQFWSLRELLTLIKQNKNVKEICEEVVFG